MKTKWLSRTWRLPLLSTGYIIVGVIAGFIDPGYLPQVVAFGIGLALGMFRWAVMASTSKAPDDGIVWETITWTTDHPKYRSLLWGTDGQVLLTTDWGKVWVPARIQVETFPHGHKEKENDQGVKITCG